MTDQQRLDDLIAAARAMHANPNDMEARKAFVQRTFNLDRLAYLLTVAFPARPEGVEG